MDKYIYRIYGKSKKGYMHIGNRKTKEEAYILANGLSPKDFEGYIIIENNITHNCDFPLDVVFFKNKECKVEYVDDLKTDIEVKATELKIKERSKNKEERDY